MQLYKDCLHNHRNVLMSVTNLWFANLCHMQNPSHVAWFENWLCLRPCMKLDLQCLVISHGWYGHNTSSHSYASCAIHARIIIRSLISICEQIWENGPLWSRPQFWDIDILWKYRESAVFYCKFQVHSYVESLFMRIYISHFCQPRNRENTLKISERMAGHYGS